MKMSDVYSSYLDDIERLEKENKKLKEQLDISKKALKGVSVWANTGNGGEMAVKKIVEKALKEIEGVK